MCSHYALQFFLSFFTFSLLNANKPYKTYFLVAFQYVYSNYVLINCSRLSINIHTEQDIDLQMSRRIEKKPTSIFYCKLCTQNCWFIYTNECIFGVFLFRRCLLSCYFPVWRFVVRGYLLLCLLFFIQS